MNGCAGKLKLRCLGMLRRVFFAGRYVNRSTVAATLYVLFRLFETAAEDWLSMSLVDPDSESEQRLLQVWLRDYDAQIARGWPA